jgi:DNA processing protein
LEDEKKAYYERVAFLALAQIKGIGFHSLKKLAESNLRFYDLLTAESYDSFRAKLSILPKKVAAIDDAEVSWEDFRKNAWRAGQALSERLSQLKINLIFSFEDDFPTSLQRIGDPPKWLFVQGNTSVLQKNLVAIVGTRKPSEEGMFLARYIGLLMERFQISATVSGLAPGIDQAIHEHSIKMRIPTIAILGTGIFSDYPAGTAKLKEDMISQGGAIVTEYLPFQSYSAENFVNRNRLQAALADILIPIEWKIKSGTAHTVNYAHKFRKQIICLRLPTWNQSHDELEYAKSIGASVFTIPGEECELLKTVSKCEKNMSVSRPSFKQLSMSVLNKEM